MIIFAVSLCIATAVTIAFQRHHAEVASVGRAGPRIERTGIVTRVIDGDTIVVNGETIRLAGIDAPEIYNPKLKGPEWGAYQTKKIVENLCFGKEVGLDVDDLRPKSYGRIVAVVYLRVNENWMNLNAELVRGGHARIVTSLYDAGKSEFDPRTWLRNED